MKPFPSFSLCNSEISLAGYKTYLICTFEKKFYIKVECMEPYYDLIVCNVELSYFFCNNHEIRSEMYGILIYCQDSG